MRVLFWVPYPTEGPSNRYRVEQYLPYLERTGIRYTLHPFWSKRGYEILYRPGHILEKIYFLASGTISRIFDMLLIGRYDIVFIHREGYPLGGAYFERILSMIGKPVIFDFDDAIFLQPNSNQNRLVKMLKCPRKIEAIVKMSSAVIAGNEYLACFARKFNENVEVIPTSIDTDKFSPRSGKVAKSDVAIGWMGSWSTAEFVNMVTNVMVDLSKRYSNVKFKIVGGSLKIPGLNNIESKPWSLADETADLESFDIGIMPMSDNEWNRGKCGFKAILYMSMGIPSVCSPVGVNADIISDDVNGFLANNEAEWVSKLSGLIDNGELMARIGNAGRKTVEERYSVKINAPKFLHVIENVYSGISKKDGR